MDKQSVKELTGAAAIATVLIAAIFAGYRHGRRREILMLQTWAERNHFQLLDFRQRAFCEPAPFLFWTSHRQPNYFVRVRNQHGKERSGWVRLGTIWESIYWGGKDKVEVRWEESR